MSDIPIGSPPAPPGRHAAPQGWYPDPVDPSRERYWDGWSWSRNTREAAPGPASYAAHQPRQTPYPSGDHQQGPYQQGQFQQGPYQQGPYQQGPYQQAPYPQQPQPQPYGYRPAGPQTEDGVPLAGWGWRFLAGILDRMIVGVISTIFAIPIYLKMIPVLSDYFQDAVRAYESGTVAPTLDPNSLISGTDQIVLTGISVVVGMLYFALFWRSKSGTPAQLLCGLRVVPAGHGRNTEKLPWASVFVRALVWWVPIAVNNVLIIFALINVLFPLWNTNRQAIHDVAAKTQIVKIR